LAGLSSRTPADTDGIDFSQTLAGKNQPERDFLYREFPGYGGQQAVWAGRWKAVRQNLNRPAAGTASKKVSAKKKVTIVPDQIITELYDLQADPTESRNIAANHPEIVKRLESIMISQHQPSAVFPMRLLDAKITSEN
ncbi:MAG: hypothetical protein ACKO5E_12640, partial [bacterium]